MCTFNKYVQNDISRGGPDSTVISDYFNVVTFASPRLYFHFLHGEILHITHRDH